MESAAGEVDGLWPDFQYNYLDFKLFPDDFMGIPGAGNNGQYGRYVTDQISIAALALQLDYSNAQKETLAINFIQRGIDMFSIVTSGKIKSWYHNGGWNAGRKALILLSGIMLNDESMKNIGVKSGDYALTAPLGSPPNDFIYFQEDDTTFYVTQTVIDETVQCGDIGNINDCVLDEAKQYTSVHLGMPEWAIRWADEQFTGNVSWLASYRRTSTAIAWNGFVLAALVMDAKTLWNHHALFDYMDRYWALSHSLDDGWSVPEEATAPDWVASGFGAEMWDTYRADYPMPPYGAPGLSHRIPGTGSLILGTGSFQ